jgi:hypothetical protein
MAPTVKEISTTLVKLNGTRVPWIVSCYGNTILGSGMDRPIMCRDGIASYASILYPVYGDKLGYGLLDDAELTYTVDNVSPGGLMTGRIQIREALYRETTNERSWVGQPTDVIDLGDTPSSVSVTSTSWALYDREVTHRIFYVCYLDVSGVYYEAAKIPYTGETWVYDPMNPYPGDTAEINVTPDVLLLNRPLEEKKETLVYPAVSTAVFWKGRIWGACLEPKKVPADVKFGFFKDSDIVYLNPDDPETPSYQFDQSDHYRGIVVNGQIVAFIDRIVHNRMAKIRMPGDISDISVWPDATVEYDGVELSGNMADVYSTPIYAGGAGGAIEYGIMSWCPLDTYKDEGFYASGAKICRLATAGDDLCIIYDRGIAFLSGDVSAGAPATVRHFIGAKDVGSFNPDSVWQVADGSLWFQGNGRIYTVRNGQVIEASKMLGVSNLWDRNVENSIYGNHLFQTAYNPGRNMALMVNVPKKGEGTGELGTYGLAICHDTNSINPVRFPVRFKSVSCEQLDDGTWQFKGGTDDGMIYNIMVKDQKWDVVGDDNVSVPVDGFYTTGVHWVDGHVKPAAFRFLIESDAEHPIELKVEADLKKQNVFSGQFDADVSVDVTDSQLRNQDWTQLFTDHGFGVQYRISAAGDGVERDYKLVKLVALEDVMEPKGMN